MSFFSDLCRLCAAKIDGLLSYNILAPEHGELLEKIHICLPVQISEEDNYPKFICMDCAIKLDVIFDFRERCLLTAQLFHQMTADDVRGVLDLQETAGILSQPLTEPQKCDVEMISLSFTTETDQFILHHENSLLSHEKDAFKNQISSDGLQVYKEISIDQMKPEEIRETKGEKLSDFIDKSDVEVKSKTKEKTKCSECGKIFPSKYKLSEHMRKHTGEKPFSCSYISCSKSFRSKIGLAQHEASHSGQFDLSCSTCGKGFQSRSYLKVHQRVHSIEKPFCCQQCPQSFKSKQSLIDHINRHLGVKPYLCDICGRGFITKGLCKSHQKTHTGQDNRQYPCHICRKLFVSKSYLRIHFNIHSGEKPYMCEVCGKSFLTAVDLKIHSTMHTGEKSFVCETCGKAFARRDALRCHRRSHTGERPYKCEYCGQSFSQFSPMAIHKRLHTGERPYPCADCPKAFVSRSTLSSHRKKHHENGAGERKNSVAEADELRNNVVDKI